MTKMPNHDRLVTASSFLAALEAATDARCIQEITSQLLMFFIDLDQKAYLNNIRALAKLNRSFSRFWYWCRRGPISALALGRPCSVAQVSPTFNHSLSDATQKSSTRPGTVSDPAIDHL
jgi:hypothetical protein